MKILILGADGYLGWPTAIHFQIWDTTFAVDNLSNENWKWIWKEPINSVKFFKIE